MAVTLEVLNTESNIRRVRITRTAVIGRGKECGLRIASQHVSRRHCELIVGKDAVRIRDLNSSNGTFINNKPLVPGVVFEIDPEDELRLGSVRLSIDFEPVAVERPVLKSPVPNLETGALAGLADEADPPAPKFDVTENLTLPAVDKTTRDAPDSDEVPAFEEQETVAAMELPDDDGVIDDDSAILDFLNNIE